MAQQSDIDRINETINNVADTVNAVINTTRQAILNSPKRKKSTLYRNMDSEKKSSLVQKIFGGGMMGGGIFFAAVSVLGIIFRGIFGVGGMAEAILNLFPSIALIIGGVVLLSNGIKKGNRIKRFESYLEALGTKTYITLEILSQFTGKSIRFIAEDLQDMISRKMFLQGHLDDQKTSLITSDETYKDYRRAAAIQKIKAEQETAQDESLKNLSPEARDIVRRGEEYITKIQQINTELPGEVITLKLQKLESVIRRILEEAKQQPQSVMDLRKLMNYYLPTTWKLLEAYKSIEDESIKTPQMRETQKNVEDTIDTVNDAFENLLDQLFRNTAWDISSDISVLNSMLAQEGLKDNEFETLQK